MPSVTVPLSHAARLGEAYRVVGDRTWEADDFLVENLAGSRDLYTLESLAARRPRPKELEVCALLSGLPFETSFANQLVHVQRRISTVVGDSLHYWVAPANLGVEFCVFKWPAEPWPLDRIPVIRKVLESIRWPSFQFEIRGIQVNPDGCVVAKGFDEDAALFAIRERLKSELPFLPTRQSNWAHVPLGRILEPVGQPAFTGLRRLVLELSDAIIATTQIDIVKLVHETRWYMEEKTVLAEYALGD